MSDPITTVLHTDPACPWAYSEIPALSVIQWRYGAQLDWRLVTIGLTESAQQYIDRGYTPIRQARGYARLSPIRHAVCTPAQGPHLGHGAGVPGDRGVSAARAGQRVARAAGVAADAVQLAARAR